MWAWAKYKVYMKPVGSRGSSKKYTDNYISPETTFLFNLHEK